MSKPDPKPPPPVFTAEMGAMLDYDLLDSVIAEQEAAFDYCSKCKRPDKFDREKSDVWWAIRILRKMEEQGLVPARTWLGIQAQQSIVLADWIYSHIESRGLSVQRTTTKGEPS